MRNLKNSFIVIAGFVTIGIIIGVVLTTNFNIHSKSNAAVDENKIYTESREADQPQQISTAGNFNPNAMFVDMVKKVRPSIVAIYTTKNIKVHPFYRFFRDQHDVPEDEFQSEVPQNGLGSGIIISKDGYILTNHHVVNDVDELNVKLLDNTEYEAKIIGTDPTTDIALIKIEAEDLPIAVLGNSDNVQIGEWVMAMGSPLNLTSTVTAGIVSALSRDINILRDQNMPNGIENFIQTDAAINPGNSGGALVNLEGEVIGVNSAIATRTNYYMGYGFSVPINIAKSVVDDLLKFGEVRRGYLGVYIEAMNPVKAKGVKMDKPRGVFISSVIPGKSAEKAGLKEGDVVLTVNGKAVNQPNELQAKIGTYNPGEKVQLEVWRNGKKMSLSAVLEGRDDLETQGIAEKPEQKMEKNIPNLGMKVRDLTGARLKNLELKSGVEVYSVTNYSVAVKAGIGEGDIIYQMEGKNIESVDDFQNRLSKYSKGDVIKLKIRRKMTGQNFDRLLFIQIP